MNEKIKTLLIILFVCIVSSLLSSCSNPAEDYVTVECIVQKRVVMVSSVDWKTEDGSYYFLQEEKYSTNSYKWFVVTPEDVIKVKKYLDSIEPEDKAKDIVPSSPINFENYTPEIVEFRLAEGKVVVLEFIAEWCLNCQSLRETVLHNPKVVAELNSEGVAPITIDLTGNNVIGNEFLEEVGGERLPLVIILKPNGDEVSRSDSYTVPQILSGIKMGLSK